MSNPTLVDDIQNMTEAEVTDLNRKLTKKLAQRIALQVGLSVAIGVVSHYAIKKFDAQTDRLYPNALTED